MMTHNYNQHVPPCKSSVGESQMFKRKINYLKFLFQMEIKKLKFDIANKTFIIKSYII